MQQHYHQSKNMGKNPHNLYPYTHTHYPQPHHQQIRQTQNRHPHSNNSQNQFRHPVNNQQSHFNGNLNYHARIGTAVNQPHSYQSSNESQNYTHDGHEENIKVIKQSRRAILGNYVVITTLFYLGYYGISKPSNINTLNQLGWFFLIIAIIALIYTESKINYKKLIITSKRAILNEGLLKSNRISIRYSSITEILSSQTLFQRLLNYGNLTIRTSGIKREQDLSINHISNPNYVKKLLEQFMIGM